MSLIDAAHTKATEAQEALDDARFEDAVRDARAAWQAIDGDTEESQSAFEIWMRGSLIESQAWDYLDRRARAESSARRSFERAWRVGRGGPWHARAAIRRIETVEWGQEVDRAALAYLYLSAKLDSVDWGLSLALVCCYQMISCRLKGAPGMVGDLAFAQGEALADRIDTPDVIGSFKRWQAVDLADRAERAPVNLDRAVVLLGESRELKAIGKRRVRIGEAFPAAFLRFACEAPDAEESLEAATRLASSVGLRQYVRGSELLVRRFLN